MRLAGSGKQHPRMLDWRLHHSRRAIRDLASPDCVLVTKFTLRIGVDTDVVIGRASDFKIDAIPTIGTIAAINIIHQLEFIRVLVHIF